MKICLIVDDSRVIRSVARTMLEEMKFDVCEATNGKEALEMCRVSMPDAILLDWNMPIMTGIEFLIELRKIPEGGDPIVLFCTTENDMGFIRRAIDAGANEYIMKPFDSEILRSKLEQVGLC